MIGLENGQDLSELVHITVIDKLLNNYRAEQQTYNRCRSILKFSDSYSLAQLENTCKIALDHLSIPYYKNIKLIIQNNQDSTKKRRSR